MREPVDGKMLKPLVEQVKDKGRKISRVYADGVL